MLVQQTPISFIIHQSYALAIHLNHESKILLNFLIFNLSTVSFSRSCPRFCCFRWLSKSRFYRSILMPGAINLKSTQPPGELGELGS